jgi:ubiquinone/menaquinone biosynthesis C-methylase UbiE
MATRNPWQYNEMIQAGANHADLERARTYDENMLKFRNYTKEAEYLIELLSINQNHAIIDFGCGTGALTMELARKCREVYAIDVSQPMLTILQEKADKERISNIEYINAGYLTYEHQDAPVDIIVTKAAFHHLPDFWKVIALSRMNGMLKENGKLFLSDVVFSFDNGNYEAEINYFLDNIRVNTGENLYQDAILHIKEEFSTFDWIMDEMLKRTGFEIVRKDTRTPTTIDYYCMKKKTSEKS